MCKDKHRGIYNSSADSCYTEKLQYFYGFKYIYTLSIARKSDVVIDANYIQRVMVMRADRGLITMYSCWQSFLLHPRQLEPMHMLRPAGGDESSFTLLLPQSVSSSITRNRFFLLLRMVCPTLSSILLLHSQDKRLHKLNDVLEKIFQYYR